tara:strand:+ start:53550 stop:56546 length:2997 start_codon:yes stop_codon:yes gene_type:complete
MSATNPQEEKSKPLGLSNRVLFVDHNPTQHLMDTFGINETPMFAADKGYYTYGDSTLPAAPKINRKADLFRFHIGKYYREFTLTSVYGPQLKNKKLVLNQDAPNPIITSGAGYGYKMPASVLSDIWDPLIFSSTGNTSASSKKLTLATQTDLTDYTTKRNFSPVSVTVTKALITAQPAEDGFKQTILIDYYEDPTAPENTKFSFKKAMLHFDSPEPGVAHNAAWKDYVLGFSEQSLDFINLNKLNLGNSGTFTDHTFSYNFPITKPDLKGNNNSYKTLYASIQPEYNYFMKRYEEALAVIGSQTQHCTEQYLPNIYVFADLFGKEAAELVWGLNSNTDFKQLLELEGLSETQYWHAQGSVSGKSPVHSSGLLVGDVKAAAAGVPSKNAINVGKAISSSFNGYLTKWSKLFEEKIGTFLTNVSNAGVVPEIFTKSRNLVIPPYRNKNLGKTENIKKLFPMATEIEFSTDSNTEFSELLVQSNTWDNILSEIIKVVEGQSDNPYKSSLLLNGFSEQRPVTLSGTALPQDQNIVTGDFDLQNVNVFDIKKWIEEISQDAYQTLNNNSVILDLDFVAIAGTAGYDYNSFFNTLALKVLKSKFGQLRDKHRRPYQDIINGEKCYNETVFYRVEKINPSTFEVIQNFYFVNSPDIDTIKYIDTQVFYDKRYEYRIYAWQLVLGSSYEYRSPVFSSGDPTATNPVTAGIPSLEAVESMWPNHHFAVVDLHMKDSAVLIEVPYYQPSEIRVIDDPPVAPEVEMIPYKNVGDKILMFLRPNVGEYKLPPRVIEESDVEELEKLRQVRGYGPEDDVRYSADDYITTYEIYRMTKSPRSYEDFAGQRIVTLENETSFIDDTILPNTKYYYVFRSIDVHGNKSIPSDIYELEMLQNLDAVYPVINIVSMDTYEQEQLEKTKKSTKMCRKYLYLKPAQTQVEINYNEAEDLEDVPAASDIQPKLGYESEGVLGKKFKIRLISKKTGKRIDFNLDFRTSYNMTKIVKNNETP